MRSLVVPLMCLTLLACTRPKGPSEVIEPDAEQVPTKADANLGDPEWADAMLLARGEGHDHDITEVWLDPSATAALSLDGTGGVRLWPVLAPAPDGDDLDALTPIRLPLHEPLTLSFARTSESSFLIAAIDTAQAGRVIEVRIDEGGRAEMIERFTMDPSDPLFELHVLDDGERLLALGVDHRLRLYDRKGELLDELSEHGFAPWQLRIVGRGESRKLAVVLAQPTRVQSLTLEGNELAVVGEARRVRNDRGPNLNDLQLTADGRHATSFRRPTSTSREWTLELLELATGEVRLLHGEVEGTIRPRLHLIDEERALLEDGTGFGYWIDLRGGVIQPPGFELPEDTDDLPDEARVTAAKVPLVNSFERQRWHSSIVEGLRVAPDGRSLVLDPIESDVHHRLGHDALADTQVGFSADGSRVAWATDGSARRWSESIAEPGTLQPLTEDGGYTWFSGRSYEIADGRGRTYSFQHKYWDSKLKIVDGQGQRVETYFDDNEFELVLPSPDGRWLAIVGHVRGRGPDSSRLPPTLVLGVYAMAELPESPVKKWEIELAPGRCAVVWSPDSSKLGVAESVGGLVLTSEGELLLERRHGNFGWSTGNDAEVSAAQVEALREWVGRGLGREF